MKECAVGTGELAKPIPKEHFQLVGRHRLTQKTSLDLAAVVLPQERDLLGGLAPFRDYPENDFYPTEITAVATAISSSASGTP